MSFTAECDGANAVVSWTTASERNNDYFILERSADAISFEYAAKIAGAGNSIETNDYQYTDYDMYEGYNYYRLRQVDYDGKQSVSEIITVKCSDDPNGNPSVEAYPNPFMSDITLELYNFDNAQATIEVFDIEGKLLLTEKTGSTRNYYTTTLNLENFSPAMYNIRIIANDIVIVKQVIKQ